MGHRQRFEVVEDVAHAEHAGAVMCASDRFVDASLLGGTQTTSRRTFLASSRPR
jgi:hypothetical protein